MGCGVCHAQHAAVAVANDDGRWVTALRHPLSRVVIVRNTLTRELVRSALGRAAVPNTENVMTPAVEGKAREPEFSEHGR